MEGLQETITPALEAEKLKKRREAALELAGLKMLQRFLSESRQGKRGLGISILE